MLYGCLLTNLIVKKVRFIASLHMQIGEECIINYVANPFQIDYFFSKGRFIAMTRVNFYIDKRLSKKQENPHHGQHSPNKFFRVKLLLHNKNREWDY